MVNRTDRRYSRPPLPHNEGCSCRACNECNGCNGCNGSNGCNGCNALRSRLQTIDFSIVDTVLYLDAYPDCKEALAHYHTLVSERDALLVELSEKCKMPMTSCSVTSRDTWDWTMGPWPWQIDAN